MNLKRVTARSLCVILAVAGLDAVLVVRLHAQTRAVSEAPEHHRTVLQEYCAGCHSSRNKIGRDTGVNLDVADLSNIPAHADMWERVVRKLRVGAMPPPGARRPEAATYDELLSWLEGDLDRYAAAHPSPGRARLRRLNRVEYGNAIRDLLALDIDVTTLLPPDDSAYGFDNISDVLGVSPSLQEHYLTAASKLSALAVGDPEIGPEAATYRVRQDLSQNQHIEGLPLGTVGGTLVHHNFPLDGEYQFQITFFRNNLGMMRGLEYPHRLEYTMNGEQVHVATIGGQADLDAAFQTPTETADATEKRMRVRVRVKAGARDVGVAFLENVDVLDTNRLQPSLRSSADTLEWLGRPHILTLSITGPFNASGPGDTASRQRIFVCRPAKTLDETPCARRILSRLARRAYRQPVSDADVQPLMSFYHSGRREGTFDTGIQRALQAILAEPRFLFRVERDPADIPSGAVYRINDVELASRLSFFLWSSIPDEELLAVAAEGKLKDPVTLDRQVRRMLRDSKSDAIVSNFAGQWLQLRNVRNELPNSDQFPDFDDNLRQAFQRETELLFASIMREDRNVLELMTADYTFVNERLARHYGIPNVYGSWFRRVPVPQDARRGLLGQGSMLLVTSHAERTSPVLRGKWILENILGTPPPPPPPDVPTLKENEAGQKPKTMREQMSEHRENPVCASCHKVMDPIGFALENFDAVGAWRTREAGEPIDASGELGDGTHVDGITTLRAALLRRPEVFVGTMTEKLLTYALGRGLDAHDMPAVREIVRNAAPEGYRFSQIVLGVVHSAPFQTRMKGTYGDQ